MKATKSASPIPDKKELLKECGVTNSFIVTDKISHEQIERFKKEMEKMGIDTSKGVVILGKNKEIVYKK